MLRIYRDPVQILDQCYGMILQYTEQQNHTDRRYKPIYILYLNNVEGKIIFILTINVLTIIA